MKKKEKIFVGISGGVDSSVVAYLLKKQGYDVHGVFVKTWSPEWLPCTWVAEKRDAMRVCAHLGIPFHFLDAEEEYKKGVAEYMIAEYRAGRTPNPDVLCNRVIKFGVMWEYARTHGASHVATGHYARVENRRLLAGVDQSKDQSYFLWMLTREDLEHVLFPIGHLQKQDVRIIAEKAGLFTGEKKDSQGICFLGDVDMREFLGHYIEQKQGNVVTKDGRVVGVHEGVWFYTLGERHGFTITDSQLRQTPQYVVGKDIERNEIVVASSVAPDEVSHKRTVTLREFNLINDIETNVHYLAQVRYHGKKYPASILENNTVVIEADDTIPLGQSLVIYKDDILVGGGVIDNVE